MRETFGFQCYSNSSEKTDWVERSIFLSSHRGNRSPKLLFLRTSAHLTLIDIHSVNFSSIYCCCCCWSFHLNALVSLLFRQNRLSMWSAGYRWLSPPMHIGLSLFIIVIFVFSVPLHNFPFLLRINKLLLSLLLGNYWSIGSFQIELCVFKVFNDTCRGNGQEVSWR